MDKKTFLIVLMVEISAEDRMAASDIASAGLKAMSDHAVPGMWAHTKVVEEA